MVNVYKSMNYCFHLQGYEVPHYAVFPIFLLVSWSVYSPRHEVLRLPQFKFLYDNANGSRQLDRQTDRWIDMHFFFYR
jgi:hypothetical protein